MNKKQKSMLLRIIVAAVMLIGFHFMPLTGAARFTAYFSAYLIIGGDILIKAGKGIKNKQVFDENFLMAVATIGAIALALYKTGDYTEAVAVMLFYQTGELFQSYAVGKSRKNISALMDIRPDYANIEYGGQLKRVSPEEVGIGSIIVIQPGEKVPLDGIVTAGESALNTAALTGESKPRSVKPGDEVISGCINISGVLHVQTSKEFGESTVSKFLIWLKTPVHANQNRKTLFQNSRVSIRRPFVTALWHWPFCRRCCDYICWICRPIGKTGFTAL